MKRGLQFAILLLMLPVSVTLADSTLDLTQRYLLLATTRTATMQRESDEAAACQPRCRG
jgi:hypothetical protein